MDKYIYIKIDNNSKLYKIICPECGCLYEKKRKFHHEQSKKHLRKIAGIKIEYGKYYISL